MKTNNGLIFDKNGLSSPDIDNAGFHNSIYRGKDITSYLSDGSLWARISNGKFIDLFIGDYFNVTVNGTSHKMEIAAFDWFYNYGFMKLTKHHIVIIPEKNLEYAAMNSSNTTSGGYVGSNMFTSVLPVFASYLETALGAAHVLSTNEYLTSNVDTNAKNVMRPDLTGASNECEFKDSKANLLSETEVYGHLSCGSSGYECSMGNSNQLPLFRLNPSKILINNDFYWLRTIASSSFFCDVDGYGGGVDYSRADNVISIRPRFVIG